MACARDLVPFHCSLLTVYCFSAMGGCEAANVDELVKSRKSPFSVIPVKTGIQSF
jgi:hypothetical protein